MRDVIRPDERLAEVWLVACFGRHAVEEADASVRLLLVRGTLDDQVRSRLLRGKFAGACAARGDADDRPEIEEMGDVVGHHAPQASCDDRSLTTGAVAHEAEVAVQALVALGPQRGEPSGGAEDPRGAPGGTDGGLPLDAHGDDPVQRQRAQNMVVSQETLSPAAVLHHEQWFASRVPLLLDRLCHGAVIRRAILHGGIDDVHSPGVERLEHAGRDEIFAYFSNRVGRTCR